MCFNISFLVAGVRFPAQCRSNNPGLYLIGSSKLLVRQSLLRSLALVLTSIPEQQFHLLQTSAVGAPPGVTRGGEGGFLTKRFLRESSNLRGGLAARLLLYHLWDSACAWSSALARRRVTGFSRGPWGRDPMTLCFGFPFCKIGVVV